MTAAPPPLTPRRWLSGLLDIIADLVQQIGYVLSHVGDGIEAIADHLEPSPATTSTAPTGWQVVQDGDHVHYLPLGDSIDHDRSDECPCGPAMRCQQTGRGDVWHIGHHRLAPRDTNPTTEGA